MKVARDMLRDVPGARAWQRTSARLARESEAAILARDEAICRAVTLKYTGDEIAHAFSLSRQRVYQIVAEANRVR